MKLLVCFCLLLIQVQADSECQQRLLSRTGNPCSDGYIKWLPPVSGLAILGQAILVKGNMELKECRELCWTIPGCKSIDFQGDVCYIHGENNNTQPAEDFVHQSFECCLDECHDQCLAMSTELGHAGPCESGNAIWLQPTPGVAIVSGHEIITFRNDILQSCQAKCFEYPGCRGATLHVDGTCTLSSVDGPLERNAYSSALGFQCCPTLRPELPTMAPLPTPAPTPAPTTQPTNDKCSKVSRVDLGFVLDASHSIGEENFNVNLKNAVKNIINQMLPGDGNVPSDNGRVAVVTFHNYSTVDFNLNKYHTKNDILAAVDAIEYPYRGFTALGEGLNKMRLNVAPLFREGVPSVVVVIADGDENIGKSKYVKEAPLLRSSADFVYAIGVGDSINPAILNAIASKPEYSLTADDYENIVQQLAGFSQTICSEMEELIAFETPMPLY